jgi:hypothetical protein
MLLLTLVRFRLAAFCSIAIGVAAPDQRDRAMVCDRTKNGGNGAGVARVGATLAQGQSVLGAPIQDRGAGRFQRPAVQRVQRAPLDVRVEDSTVPPLAVMFPPALFTVLGSSCSAPAACTCPTMCLIVKDKNSRLRVLASPVLYLQSRYAPEFLFIVCDQCQTRRHGMGGDPQIVVADHLTLRFQLGPNSAVDFGGCFG